MSESGVDPRRRASKYLRAGLSRRRAPPRTVAQRAHNNQYIGCNVFYLFIRKTTYAKWISLPRCSLTLGIRRAARRARAQSETSTTRPRIRPTARAARVVCVHSAHTHTQRRLATHTTKRRIRGYKLTSDKQTNKTVRATKLTPPTHGRGLGARRTRDGRTDTRPSPSSQRSVATAMQCASPHAGARTGVLQARTPSQPSQRPVYGSVLHSRAPAPGSVECRARLEALNQVGRSGWSVTGGQHGAVASPLQRPARPRAASGRGRRCRAPAARA